jgi:hypothetical protein
MERPARVALQTSPSRQPPIGGFVPTRSNRRNRHSPKRAGQARVTCPSGHGPKNGGGEMAEPPSCPFRSSWLETGAGTGKCTERIIAEALVDEAGRAIRNRGTDTSAPIWRPESRTLVRTASGSAWNRGASTSKMGIRQAQELL